MAKIAIWILLLSLSLFRRTVPKFTHKWDGPIGLKASNFKECESESFLRESLHLWCKTSPDS